MGGLFTTLFAKIGAVVDWAGSLFVAAFAAMYLMAKDLFSWLFESFLGVAITAVKAIDVSGITPFTSSASSLPSQLLNVLSLLGVGTAISIISAAILIRFGLQLIPFTRLGS